MGYYVTDMKCFRCGKANYHYLEVGDPYSRCYHDWYQCPVCGHDPDKDKKESETENENDI